MEMKCAFSDSCSADHARDRDRRTTSSHTKSKKQIVYFCRHAEATHNIQERRAVQEACARLGVVPHSEPAEAARRSVLDNPVLRDAPLSPDGIAQSRQKGHKLELLHRLAAAGSSSSATTSTTSGTFGNSKYPTPTLVLVSPLRRALMTATELFLHNNTSSTPPKFVALEALREKRTGFCADELSHVDDLECQFPHVDFADLKRTDTFTPEKGEDNAKLRKRVEAFLLGAQSQFATNYTQETSIAMVTHKGWLREMRHVLRARVDAKEIEADFDLDHWHQTLYKNAEVRVVEFEWQQLQDHHGEGDNGTNDSSCASSSSRLTSIVSKSVENAMGNVVHDAVKHLLERAAVAHQQRMVSFRNLDDNFVNIHSSSSTNSPISAMRKKYSSCSDLSTLTGNTEATAALSSSEEEDGDDTADDSSDCM